MHVDPLVQQSFARSVAALCYLGTFTYAWILLCKVGGGIAAFGKWRHEVGQRKLDRRIAEVQTMERANREAERHAEALLKQDRDQRKQQLESAIDKTRQEMTAMTDVVKSILAPIHAPLETTRYAFRLKVVTPPGDCWKQNKDVALETGDIIEGAVMMSNSDNATYIYPRKGGSSNRISAYNVAIV
jgi:hypothetical protein